MRVVRSCNAGVSSHSTQCIGRRRLTLLCVDLHLHVKVYADDYDIRDDVENANAKKDLRVFEGYFLGDLHHTKDNDQIGTIKTL